MRLGWEPGPQELVAEFHHFELVGFCIGECPEPTVSAGEATIAHPPRPGVGMFAEQRARTVIVSSTGSGGEQRSW